MSCWIPALCRCSWKNFTQNYCPSHNETFSAIPNLKQTNLVIHKFTKAIATLESSWFLMATASCHCQLIFNKYNMFVSHDLAKSPIISTEICQRVTTGFPSCHAVYVFLVWRVYLTVYFALLTEPIMNIFFIQCQENRYWTHSIVSAITNLCIVIERNVNFHSKLIAEKLFVMNCWIL